LSQDVTQKYFKVIYLNGTNATLTSGTSKNSETGMKWRGTEMGGNYKNTKHTHIHTYTNKRTLHEGHFS